MNHATRSMIVSRSLVALLAALMTACAVAAPTSPAASPNLSGFLERLDTLRRQERIPGLSIAIVKDQSILLAAGLGEADSQRHVAAAADTPYDIASVAKPIAAVVALKLVEEKTLDLDRPLVEYSAWADFCTGFSEQPSIFAAGLRCEPAVHTLRHFLSHTATAVPGSRFSYNPVLYSWASRPMAAAAGLPFSALVDRYVFAPATMTMSARKHRALPLRTDLATRLAPHYQIDARGAVVPGAALSAQGDGAAGGVVTTALDLAKFDIALDEGRLISAASREAMMTPMRADDGTTLPYALGWFVQHYRGATLLWHCGWWENGYSALYLKIPAAQLSFIALANAEGVWRGNPLDKPEVQASRFAQAFLDTFLAAD